MISACDGRVDLESLRISARVRFPRLHFTGRYSLDARLLVLPLHGAGTIVADAGRYMPTRTHTHTQKIRTTQSVT